MRVERAVLDTNVLISAVLSPHGKPYACLLEIIVAGGADCLVTGDQDLLILNPFAGVPILTPAGFLDAIAESAK